MIPLKMHLYIQALAFVQGMTLRAVHEDCASRFLAEKAWEKGLRWWEWHRPALTDPEWVEVHVRIPAHLADKLVGDTRLEFQDTRDSGQPCRRKRAMTCPGFQP